MKFLSRFFITHNYSYNEMFLAGGVEVPEFGEPITNLTVPIGRDATFKCIVVNLGNYRVSTLFEECNLTAKP